MTVVLLIEDEDATFVDDKVEDSAFEDDVMTDEECIERVDRIVGDELGVGRV